MQVFICTFKSVVVVPTKLTSFLVAQAKPSKSWDPQDEGDWSKQRPTEQCYLRIKRDLMAVYTDPPPGVCIVPDDNDITVVRFCVTLPVPL